MTVELITGHAGAPHVSSDDAGAFNAGIVGAGCYVLNVDDGFAATLDDANHVSVGTGTAVMHGRQVRVTAPEQVNIDSGTQGQNRSDVIALRYTRDSEGIEGASLVVLKGTPAEGEADSPAIPAGSILDGASEAYMPLYDVRLEGLNVANPVALFDRARPYAEALDVMERGIELVRDECQAWDTDDKYQRLKVAKFGSYGIGGHKAQGMACDGTYLYMASHASDTGPTTISKIKMSDGSVSRKEIALTGHFNSMVYLGGWLYCACAGGGLDYGKMSCVNVSDWSFKTYDLPFDFWSVAVADAGNGAHLAGLVADGHEWLVYARENPDDWRMTPVSRFTGYDGCGIIQGCDADEDYLYSLFAYSQGRWRGQNVLSVMEWDGHVRRNLWIDGGNLEEFEDVCVPAGYDGDVWFNDIAGNVYRGTLKDTLKPEYKTWLRSPWKGQAVQNVYQAYNGTETFKSGAHKVCDSFKVQPFVYASTLAALVGDVMVGGYKFPLTYNPNNGNISCNGVLMNGYTPTYFSLGWARTSDSRQYGWSMSSSSWVCTSASGSAVRGAAAIAASSLLPGDVYVNKLVGLFGVAPNGSAIEM